MAVGHLVDNLLKGRARLARGKRGQKDVRTVRLLRGHSSASTGRGWLHPSGAHLVVLHNATVNEEPLAVCDEGLDLLNLLRRGVLLHPFLLRGGGLRRGAAVRSAFAQGSAAVRPRPRT